MLHYLFTVSPEAKFTVDISKEIARDEEFIKSLLIDMNKKGLVISINKNKSGKDYLRRKRWILSPQAYEIYKKHQNKPSQSAFSSSTTRDEESNLS